MSARLAEIEDDRGAIAWERPGGLRNMEASGGRSGGLPLKPSLAALCVACSQGRRATPGGIGDGGASKERAHIQ